MHRIIAYLPNRVFDVSDLLRARVRVGPGTAVSVRATEFADVFLGGYTSIWAGVHGPRGGRRVPWPAGFEGRFGAELSVADASAGGFWGANYATDEIGAGFHLFLIGLDLGVSPVQAFDLLLGFALLDPAGDDF